MYRTIVVATDGHEGGDRAVAAARDLAARSYARIVVVHVNELVVIRGGTMSFDPNEVEVAQRIWDQVRDMTNNGLRAELTVRTARDPARSIADTAKAVGADLIVIGPSRHDPLAGAVFGSVTQRLLRVATCPVQAVPLAGERAAAPLIKMA
ncbi:MAG: universal stress protein [Candidatus Dormibacteraeota bacterium]|nr:universal stress protein [Candidatus Dormibacteraeota bacterium]